MCACEFGIEDTLRISDVSEGVVNRFSYSPTTGVVSDTQSGLRPPGY